MVFGLFKRKKKEEKKEEENYIAKCIICNQPIYEKDLYRVIQWNREKYYIHRSCFKKLKKEAYKLVGSGQLFNF